MSGRIYLMRDEQQDGRVVERLIGMNEQGYESEKRLQELLARHSDLLAGDQIDCEEPRRWLFVSREVPVMLTGDGHDVLLDHLLLDQDGIPTLVELKRSTNPDIKNVVGQMLGYAAGATASWTDETVRELFEGTRVQEGKDPNQELSVIISPEADPGEFDPGEFWDKVKANLRTGKIRMIFMADEIPQELRRVIAFLSSQMSPATVLAVEVRQYVGDGGLKALVPQLVTYPPPTTPPPRPVSREGFIEALRAKAGTQAVEVASRILDWLNKNSVGIKWGKGQHNPTFTAILDRKGEKLNLFTLWATGYIMVYPNSLTRSEDGLRQFLTRVNQFLDPGSELSSEKRFTFSKLSSLADSAKWDHFASTYDWFLSEVKASR